MTTLTVTRKVLVAHRRSFTGWSIGTVALVLLMVLMWPSVRDMPGIDDFVQNYPPALRELFNLESFGTGRGYMNAELFSLMVPAMFLVFGIGRGARVLAGEEEDHTLDVLVSAAPSRRRVLLEMAAAVGMEIVGLAAVLFLACMVGNGAVGLGIGVGDLLRGTAAMTALGLQFAAIALALGAATGRRAVAIGVSTSIGVAMYAWYVLAQLVEPVHGWRQLSSFTLALDRGPIGPEWSWGYPVMAGVGIAALVVAIGVFDRRDLGR
jgi:ABC-2 type transport system permease protein